MRKRIGVVSITPNVRDHHDVPLEKFYNSFGRNTGNYMFTQAVYRQIDADMVHIGFSYSPEAANRELDHILIPAANWLNSRANWDSLADIVERTEVPITMIGVGVQSSTTDIDKAGVSNSAVRLIKAVARKSRFISVRGNFTRDWLRHIGVHNVITTGCPSLYMRLVNCVRSQDAAGIVLQSTRYGPTESFIARNDVNRLIYGLAGKLDTHMIYQSEIEELDYLVYGTRAQKIELPLAQYLPVLYGLKDMDALLDYLGRKGRVFFDLDAWAMFLRSTHGLISTRLHGSIIALNAGVPAILVPHDSRTSELAEFARIPTLDQSLIKGDMTTQQLERFISHADTDKYYETRRKNAQIYVDFLSDCGLPIMKDALFQ